MAASLSIVILAAGLGTRMRSDTAKVLHRAGGLPLIEHVVRLALQVTAPENVVVVVGHQAEEVAAVVAPYGVKTALQTEQRGTGHALRCARGIAPDEGHLAVLYGDAPLLSLATLQQLVNTRPEAGVVLTAMLEDPTGYGRIVRGPDGAVDSIVEQKAANAHQLAIREINSGIYCFRAERLWAHIDAITTNNPAGEFYLTDIVELFRLAGLRTEALLLEDPSELLGINTRVELAEVDRIFRMRRVRELMLGGVTIERPETVTIDPDVTVGQDSVIEAFARVLGRSALGPRVRVGAGAILRDAVIGEGTQVQPYTLIEDTAIGTAGRIGPFARLRMHNTVGDGVHIGNFVELKKTSMGDGSKANHLAYLGDATVGTHTNIGAGTITCNYDGTHKHPTTIGDGVFVGSNSTLVAPVTLESDTYVAAGSVITASVPTGALAIGRARQVVKDGWVEKKKNS